MYRAKQAGRNRIALAKEEKLVTKTAHYTVDQLKQLEKLSNNTGVSEAALMREALDELLKKYKS
jgi:predicted DNA-binding protein